MEENITCYSCESVFAVVEDYSEFDVQFCPYCGKSLEEHEDDEE